MAYPINDHTGEALSDEDVTQAHYEKVCGAWSELRLIWADRSSTVAPTLRNQSSSVWPSVLNSALYGFSHP